MDLTEIEGRGRVGVLQSLLDHPKSQKGNHLGLHLQGGKCIDLSCSFCTVHILLQYMPLMNSRQINAKRNIEQRKKQKTCLVFVL